MTAFVAYEAVLIVSSLGLGGTENFTAAIQGRIFMINAGALVGLVAMQHLGIAIGIASSSRRPIPAAARTV